MKILYLITKSEVGGAQTHVYQLGKFFNNRGYEVVVMAHPGGWLENECKKLGIRFVNNQYFSNNINPFKVFKAVKLVRKIVKEFSPDIVHCHSSGAGFVGRLAIRNKIPTIFTAHGWGFNIGVPFLQKWVAIFAEKIASRYCEKIICVSGFVKNLGLKYKIAKKEKFEIIYNGVDVVSNTAQHTKDDKIKIIFVGRLAEPKDPLVLLKAYRELSNEIKSSVEVNIIGEGPKKKKLESFVVDNKLDDVKLLGGLPRDQVFVKLAESDIFVFVSKYEGLPMTILEAMNVGLPVIASDVGGIKEIIEDGTNGFLLKNDSVEELKKVLEKIIRDNNLRKKLGKASREKVLEKFSLDAMLRETEKIYNEFI